MSEFGLSASQQTLQSTLENRERFVVEDYQRKYDWSEDQWEDFWQDLNALADGRPSHFLGSIVLIEDTSEDPDRLEVVDGQQRLATILTTFCVLRQKYEGSELGEHGENIENDYLKVSDSDYNEYRKMELTRYDDQDFEAILKGNTSKIGDSQIANLYYYLSDKIDDIDLNRADNLRKRLEDSIIIVRVECESESSAFLLFESLNYRGLELSPSDLMKTHLFKIVAESELEADIKEDWAEMTDTLRPAVTRQERFFRHYFMASEHFDIRENVSKSELYELFKRVLSDIRDYGLSIPEFVEDIKRKAQLYTDIINGQVSTYSSTNININQKINDVVFKHRPARVIILRLLTEIDNADEFENAANILENYTVRMSVQEGTGGKSRTEIFARLTSEMYSNKNINSLNHLRKELKEESPSDDEFEELFKGYSFKNNHRTLHILSGLEEYLYEGQGMSVDRSDAEIEHIVPRRVDAEKYSNWWEYLETDKERFERRYANQIGNLTVMESSVNARAGDNPFDEKIRHYENSSFEMTRNLADNDEWTVKDIEDRTEELAERVVEVWSM